MRSARAAIGHVSPFHHLSDGVAEVKTQPLVSLIEKGERRVDLIEFVAISRAMGVDPRDLFDEIIAVLPDKIDI